MNNSNYIAIVFDDEVPLMEAVRKLRDTNEKIIDVLTPFPVHGMDDALSFKRTRIPTGGFILGFLGGIFAFCFQAWVFTKSYPLIIGGKPLFAAPSFIPITFEVTILFGGVAMVIALFARSKLKPDIYFSPIDENITDDTFIILVESGNQETKAERMRSVLSGIHTKEIRY
jgi:hypothetical protein